MAGEINLLDAHPEWWEDDCPSCGSRPCHKPFEHWACGSVMELNGLFVFGGECVLRRQLSQREDENAALRRTLDEVREWAVDWFGPLHNVDWKDPDDNRSPGGEELFRILAQHGKEQGS